MKDIILLLVLQLVYVPMLALRTISMVKKLTLLTAVFGFLESIIYVFGLAIVLTGEQSLVQMLVYALGFSLGLIVGIHIENKIAIGYTSILVNIKEMNHKLISTVRESGFGVTVFQGEGKDSPRYRLDILTKRSRENELLQLIEEYEPNAFILSYEPTRFKGGFMEIMMKKQNRKRLDRNDAEVLHESDEEASWLQKEKEKIVQEVRELRNSDQSILP
ncbi:DUF2179 domain-containing protein [Proteiniclasticum sp.]|uniref:DUF2179 domain-containing protein n=1 Tax=Proteiniclasticum sp. TaxID=2053595 RepID=UPI00289BCAC1|nr:DUF2179 domain-containing protein [Proteiniclasticum sp.]